MAGLFLASSCEKISPTTRNIDLVKYLQPGVSNVFASEQVSDGIYTLFGISQNSTYDFGLLKVMRLRVHDNDITVDSIELPDLKIAFPSNLIKFDNNTSVFFALENDQNLSAFWFDNAGEYTDKTTLGGFENMVVLAATKTNEGFILLINDQLQNNYTSSVYLVMANHELTNFTTIDTQTYDASIFSVLIGTAYFNSYNLFAKLQEYCLVKEYDGVYAVNTPVVLNNNSVTIGLKQLSFQTGAASYIDIIGIENMFIKEIDVDENGTIFPVVRNIETNEISFVKYNYQTDSYTEIATKTEIDPDKKIIFAVNNTSIEQDKLVVATQYANSTYIYSPINQDIEFTIDNRYETEAKAVYWGGQDNDLLIVIGNTMLYNQYSANFIYILPQLSLTY